MKLKPIQVQDLKAGSVFVFGSQPTSPKSSTPQELSGEIFKLVIVVSVTEREVVLSPFSATWDDDDSDSGASGALIPHSVQRSHLTQCLALPVWEIGDRLLHRGRPARIVQTEPHDLHVVITYDDPSGSQFYGNLIWMDVSPTLNLLDRRTAWPSLP